MSIMFDNPDRRSRAHCIHSDRVEELGGMVGEPGSLPSGTPLSFASERDILIITAMNGGRQYRRQLMDMGLRPGLQIKVIRAGRGGPMLISVGETRLAIGRGMVEKILVVPAKQNVSRFE